MYRKFDFQSTVRYSTLLVHLFSYQLRFAICSNSFPFSHFTRWRRRRLMGTLFRPVRPLDSIFMFPFLCHSLTHTLHAYTYLNPSNWWDFLSSPCLTFQIRVLWLFINNVPSIIRKSHQIRVLLPTPFFPRIRPIRQSCTSRVVCHSRHHQDIHKVVRAAMQSGKEMNVKSDQQQQMTKPYRSAVVYYHVGFNLLLLLLLHLCLLFLLLHVCKDTTTG